MSKSREIALIAFPSHTAGRRAQLNRIFPVRGYLVREDDKKGIQRGPGGFEVVYYIDVGDRDDKTIIKDCQDYCRVVDAPAIEAGVKENLNKAGISYVEYAKEAGAIAGKISAFLTKYVSSGDKTFVWGRFHFAQDLDRSTIIKKLTEESAQLNVVDINFYHQLATLVNRARLDTQASHRKNWMGWFRITHSRLEGELNNFLNQLVTDKKITSDELSNIVSVELEARARPKNTNIKPGAEEQKVNISFKNQGR